MHISNSQLVCPVRPRTAQIDCVLVNNIGNQLQHTTYIDKWRRLHEEDSAFEHDDR